ncbi:hypothetical protein AKJ09_02244 [Labilithrix luteola]|uniref:Uncharacterized protein n=1 Tax=Labilithrix luteola TaxID=1391654 RepID=A0A0K1PPW3_9BACT|nr:hypothetical protein AKJ09_02244 [Labilithrix luteola]
MAPTIRSLVEDFKAGTQPAAFAFEVYADCLQRFPLAWVVQV